MTKNKNWLFFPSRQPGAYSSSEESRCGHINTTSCCHVLWLNQCELSPWVSKALGLFGFGIRSTRRQYSFYHNYNIALAKTEAWIFYLQWRSDNIINRKQFSQCVPCQLFSVKLTRRHIFHGRRICWVKHSGKKQEIEIGVTNMFRARKPGKVFSRTPITLQCIHPEHYFKLSPFLL